MSTAARKVAKDNDAPVSFQTNSNTTEFEYQSIDEAFPPVEPGRQPLGHTVLVQIRQPKSKSKGGVYLPGDSRSTEHYNTRVAKVVALGAMCFTSTHTRDTGEKFESELTPWPEGKWFEVGDYVEIPQYGGSRFVVPFETKGEIFDPGPGKMVETMVKEEVTFAFFKAKDIFAKILSDPLRIKAYLD